MITIEPATSDIEETCDGCNHEIPTDTRYVSLIFPKGKHDRKLCRECALYAAALVK